MELSAILTSAPEGGYIAFNPETGTTTQGETVEEALVNLREATGLYLEEFPPHITSHPLLTTFEVPAHARTSGRVDG
uniref:Predicted nuclease of the RNAse H fold, HicB family n=1 Tax=Candidatus Kentrum sp. FW TaxID=2126338 RepID=A0A450TMF4_9GAMM|nr:MAG: Predicted nuclease of the RNAse H fold, HicB family [Candidatus Kentron sp. FW]